MIRAIERALRVIDSFDAAHSHQSLQTIAERTSLSKATTFRLVNTLVTGGYLVRDTQQRYSLSLEVLRLSSFVELDVNIQNMLRPLMIELSRSLGETVALYAASGMMRVCIEAIQAAAPLMRVVSVGEHVPLPRGAVGRTMLAQMTGGEIDDILAESTTTVAPNVLRKRVELIRHRGYDVARSERVVGATAVVVPIHHRLKTGSHYCMAVVGPSARMDDHLEELTKTLQRAGRKASRELGAN